ncbi:hypothetical protein MSAN_01586100 [Mycena sanguinolenta]|uniref:Uncharacterized protein n=1 Tax=Mycena sanguinolenta TaxID=230812 RepID=A0A8H7CX90_9AGAR|nr:hypothetical protein MSAN_01586100 [Mycena sanguinolenta]
MADPTDYKATASRILREPLPDGLLAGIGGNAPRKVKETAVKWLNIYHAPPKCFSGAVTRRTAVIEVSLDSNPLEDGQALTLISETDVCDEMLDGQGKVSCAFIITIIDECVSSAVTTLSSAQGGPRLSGVSLSLDTVFSQFCRTRCEAALREQDPSSRRWHDVLRLPGVGPNPAEARRHVHFRRNAAICPFMTAS